MIVTMLAIFWLFAGASIFFVVHSASAWAGRVRFFVSPDNRKFSKASPANRDLGRAMTFLAAASFLCAFPIALSGTVLKISDNETAAVVVFSPILGGAILFIPATFLAIRWRKKFHRGHYRYDTEFQ